MNLKQYLYIFSLKKSGKAQGSKEFRFWNSLQQLMLLKIVISNYEVKNGRKR